MKSVPRGTQCYDGKNLGEEPWDRRDVPQVYLTGWRTKTGNVPSVPKFLMPRLVSARSRNRRASTLEALLLLCEQLASFGEGHI